MSSGSFVYGQLTTEWEIFNEFNSLLPNNTIRCLETDQTNTLWIGTDWGLAKFHEGTWEIYNKGNSGLTDNSIRAIDSDSENNIWIGTTLGGLFKFDGSSWTQFNTANSDIPCDFVRAITIDSSDHVWIGTVEGLSFFDGNLWQNWTIANSGILSNNITSIAQGKNGMMYVATVNGGVFYIQNGILNDYTILQNGLPDNTSLAVQVDELGNPWFASAAQGIFTDVGNLTWLVFNTSNSALPSNSLKCMLLDKDQNFYIGTHLHGIAIKTSTNDWRNYTTLNSPIPDNQILSLTKDSLENVWIGTYSQGLVRMKEGYLGLDNLNQDKPEIYPVPASSNDHILIAVADPESIVIITDQQGRTVTREKPVNGKVSLLPGYLTPGSYQVTIISSAGRKMGQLVVL